jgi:transcriptional regulator with XRE-family HTH domain
MAFSENVRRLRLERFLSQGDLARRAGMHPITVTRLESGFSTPSARSVRALAGALGVEPGEVATPDEVAELRRVLKTTTTTGAEPAGHLGADSPNELFVPAVSDDGDAVEQRDAAQREDQGSHE